MITTDTDLPPHARVENGPFGPFLSSPAEDLIEAMEEADPEDKPSLARMILEDDPACIDAYLVLADQAETTAERRALLREAVRIGNRIWTPVEGSRGRWNGDGPVVVWGHAPVYVRHPGSGRQLC